MKAKKAVAAGMSAIMFAGAFAGTMAYAPSAHADEVSPTGKGIVGGALLGGEVVVITMSLVGVKNQWAYLGGGLGGAAAGGVGGYFVEKASSDGRAPIYMLAGGLALIIPGVVLTLNATSYQGNEHATEDKAPTNVAPADPGQAGGSAVGPATGTTPAPAPTTPAPTTPAPTTPAPTTPAPAGGGAAPKAPVQAPMSMIDVQRSLEVTQLRLGMPVPVVKNAFTTQERVKYGANQVSEVHVGVLNVTF
jgi:hypothetical protein